MTRGPMLRSPLERMETPKNRVEITDRGEQGAKLRTKGTFGKKVTWVQLPENMIKPTDQNYQSAYNNDYCRKHAKKPVKTLGKSYTRSIKKFADDGISKVILPDHSVHDHYDTRPLGMPYTETQAQAINRLQRAMRTLSTEDRVKMGLDDQPATARGRVATPYDTMEAGDLITGGRGRPASQPPPSREKQRASIKTLPSSCHVPPSSRQCNQHPMNEGPSAAEQLPKAAEKVAKSIAREYDGLKRERAWMYGQSGKKEIIGHVSAKKKVDKDLKSGECLPGFKDWLELANEYEKYVVHDFAEHMAKNIGEEEYYRHGSAVPCEEDLSEEQLLSFRKYCAERENAPERPMSAHVRPSSPAAGRPPSRENDPATLDGQVAAVKTVTICSPPPTPRTPSPPKSARRVRSADFPIRSTVAFEEEPHERARSVEVDELYGAGAFYQDQSTQVPPPFRGGPMFRDPVTQSVPSMKPRRETYKHCCTNCSSCMRKKVHELAAQLQGVKPLSHEDIVRSRYLPDGITLANVYPNLGDFEHTDTLTELVKQRRRVGDKGHFVIHPQFVSENGGKKATKHTQSEVFDFTKFFK